MSGRLARFRTLVVYATVSIDRHITAAGGRGGVRLALAGLRARPTVHRVRVAGVPVPLEVRAGRKESDVRTLLHIFQEDGYDFGVQQPGWIIDAGANAGYATVWFALRHPEARIIAVEPDAANCELLRRNTASFPNVTVVEAALMAHEGIVRLIDPDEGSWAIRVHAPGATWSGGASGEEVQSVTVQGLMQLYGVERLDLLKIDIEGSELEVFADSDPWIEHTDAIVAELHDRFRPGCTRAFVAATAAFPVERVRGENVFVSRR